MENAAIRLFVFAKKNLDKRKICSYSSTNKFTAFW